MRVSAMGCILEQFARHWCFLLFSKLYFNGDCSGRSVCLNVRLEVRVGTLGQWISQQL